MLLIKTKDHESHRQFCLSCILSYQSTWSKWFIFKLFSFQIPQRMKSIVFVCFIMKLRINWESSTVIQVQYANPTTKSPALFLFLFCGWYYFEFKDFRSSLFSLNSSCVCPEATKPQESSFFFLWPLSPIVCDIAFHICHFRTVWLAGCRLYPEHKFTTHTPKAKFILVLQMIFHSLYSGALRQKFSLWCEHSCNSKHLSNHLSPIEMLLICFKKTDHVFSFFFMWSIWGCVRKI